ncbi:hypothetical protein Desaci_2610 [Desulfosporosinus acidiphilus SJ4]|uniref:Uncharacterized protein n=1 Tax=Desulfosporosinus acidiphilus (strain DSM 22704 / JCM 16185 / SJ4) TaxID=646529 RepID=I4D6W9_DESAJ|nr:hypothetical protein [Desulfosporosinus acidiphilus]AFM41543.1 hypothetical protein Desaci_2610 [Desulfosporosinus acidiphilus SJ4]
MNLKTIELTRGILEVDLSNISGEEIATINANLHRGASLVNLESKGGKLIFTIEKEHRSNNGKKSPD